MKQKDTPMTMVPRTMLPTFATAMEMSQFFLARHQGDAEAAAQDMERVLRRDRRLYKQRAGKRLKKHSGILARL
jgi:hypothetical protein